MKNNSIFRFLSLIIAGLLLAFSIQQYWPSFSVGQTSLQNILSEVEKDYICSISSREYTFAEFGSLRKESIQTEIVQNLARQLSSCVKANQNQLGLIDLSQLSGVTYTTKLLDDRNSLVVIAGIGNQDPEDVNLKSDLKKSSDGMVSLFTNIGDQNNFSLALDQRKISKEENKELLDLTSRFGKLLLHTQGSIEYPEKLRLSDNQVSTESDLSLQHQIEGINIPPLVQIFFKAEASDEDIISNQSRKIGSAELTFNGLLLKGIPAYLKQNKAIKELEKNGLHLETNSEDNSKAKLIKILEMPKDDKLDKIRLELRKNKSILDKEKNQIIGLLKSKRDLSEKLKLAKEIGDLKLEKKLNKQFILMEPKLQKNELILQTNINKKYEDLAKLPLKAKYICGPEFIREFKFPIFERSASSNGASGSASGGIGVSGDVLIDISKPSCEFTFVPPMKAKSSIFSDISVTSNGYFGVRGDASGEKDFGITFLSQEYGNLSLSDIGFNEDEKKAINSLVLKSIDDAKDDEKKIIDFAQKLESDFINPLINSIENALIGTEESPVSGSEICSSLFRKVGMSSGSKEDLVCWASGIKLMENPSKLLKEVNENISSANARLKVLNDDRQKFDKKLSDYKDQANDLAKKITDWVICFNEKKCKEEKNKLTDLIREVEKNIDDTKGNIDDLNDKIFDYNSKLPELVTKVNQYNDWLIYTTHSKIREVAKKYVYDNVILNNIDIKSIAKELLDLAWEIEHGTRKVTEWVDIAHKIVHSIIPDRLSFSAAASGRIAFNSQSHLIETRPQFETISALEFKNDTPSANLKFVAFKNGPEGEKGRIGGLNIIGLKFKAKLIACLGGKVEGDTCSSGKEVSSKAKDWELLSPIIADKSISDNEIVVFEGSVPLKVKS
jgi:hypothetical protein